MSRPLTILIGILLAGLIAAGLWWWLGSGTIDEEAALNTNSISDSNANTNSAPSISQDSPLYPVAKSRDTSRIVDIRMLQAGLESYRSDNGYYPQELSELVGGLITRVPTDPQTNVEYSYTPIGTAPISYYSLYYVLEVGVEGIAAGEHTAGPGSISNE